MPWFSCPSLAPLLCRDHQAKNSLGAPAEVVGQGKGVLLIAQKAAEGGGWSSPPDFMPVLMTKTYMCSEQLLASQEPWVVTWCLVCYHPFVAEGHLTADADHMALKTHACPTSPSVGCTLASSCPYVLRGACCCQSLSLFTVLFLCLKGHKMLSLQKSSLSPP